MNVLAVDPGTKCGYAIRTEDGPIVSGVWNLAGGRHEGGGMRFLRLRRYLRETHDLAPLDAVFYEEVRGHKGTDAAHIYGGIIATLTSFCEDSEIPYVGIPVGTIKKHATGRGNANKAAMIEAAEEKFGAAVLSDDEADALLLLDYALAEHL